MGQRPFLFRYAIDRRSVAIVLVTALLSVSPFLLLPAHLATWELAVLWGLSLYARCFGPYAQHNHGHLPVFRARALNVAYDAVLTLITGYPTALWELHHNLGHHHNVLEPEKDVASILDPRTGRPVSRLWYTIRGNWTIVPDSIRIARREAARGKPKLLRKLTAELVLQVAVLGLLLALNAKLALIFVVGPNLLAAALVWWESYVHHLGVPGDDVYSVSVTVLGRRFNALNFNIGHHTAHHEKPTLHWSLLPERTARILPKIPASCLRESPGPGAHAVSPARAPEPALAHFDGEGAFTVGRSPTGGFTTSRSAPG
jgi:fatty acid desaturase